VGTALAIYVQTCSGAEQISPEKDKTLNQMEGGVKMNGYQHFNSINQMRS